MVSDKIINVITGYKVQRNTSLIRTHNKLIHNKIQFVLINGISCRCNKYATQTRHINTPLGNQTRRDFKQQKHQYHARRFNVNLMK